MRALSYHCRAEMMRTAGHIRDDLGFLRVRDAWLEHADDRTGAITFNAAKLNGFANNRGIFRERVRPETISENDDAGSLGTVILRSDQAAEHGAQPHHIEIGPVDHAAIDFARLTQSENGESDGREVTEFAQRFDTRLQVLNFRNRPGTVFGPCAGRALPDVNQLVFIAIDQRLDEHAANERENGGIGTNTKRQRDNYDKREPRRFPKLAKSEAEIVHVIQPAMLRLD